MNITEHQNNSSLFFVSIFLWLSLSLSLSHVHTPHCFCCLCFDIFCPLSHSFFVLSVSLSLSLFFLYPSCFSSSLFLSLSLSLSLSKTSSPVVVLVTQRYCGEQDPGVVDYLYICGRLVLIVLLDTEGYLHDEVDHHRYADENPEQPGMRIHAQSCVMTRNFSRHPRTSCSRVWICSKHFGIFSWILSFLEESENTQQYQHLTANDSYSFNLTPRNSQKEIAEKLLWNMYVFRKRSVSHSYNGIL